MLAKMSGIGCSSKTPAYFVNGAHGFNSAHGRMPAIATGALLANRNLLVIIRDITALKTREIELQEALEHQEMALSLWRKAGDLAGEGGTLNEFGNIYRRLGRHGEALDYRVRA